MEYLGPGAAAWFPYNLSVEIGAELMATYWVAMKTAETLTPEEIEYGGVELAELFDDAVQYLFGNLAEDVADEVEVELP